MIPFFSLTHISLGPFSIQVWGLMIGLGFIFGAFASARMARARGMDPKIIYDLAFWIVIFSLIGGRVFHVVFYEPLYYAAHPFKAISIWEGGLSMYGGFIGAIVAWVFFCKKRRLNFLRLADTAVFGLPLGIFIGRIGCFLIHDHPGVPTNFFLGIRWPDGIIRHDHGLYLSLNGLLLFSLFLLMAKMKVRKGTYVAFFCLWEGVTRFGLDFLRAREGDIVDARYMGLTPTQYASMILVFAGGYLFFKLQRGTLKA
jgi:phosphatidylglycerol:prolipoprotein diacylglycerol transferase